ncbi:unnamed protein product [Echinostoma caproni]|uniref:BPTI/Kunitz inhibitor domain-containing protein n=1 Tax=Echinostoma caproni TaxID=27848 RepID=A0A3P8FMR1_9TREM|nr:unnamed protein product [Echinostoma caproni]
MKCFLLARSCALLRAICGYLLHSVEQLSNEINLKPHKSKLKKTRLCRSQFNKHAPVYPTVAMTHTLSLSHRTTYFDHLSALCRLDIDSGQCFHIFIRYAYNWRTERCQRFIYGGCGGNQNRFDTLEECIKKCHRKSPVDQKIGPKSEIIQIQNVNFMCPTSERCHRLIQCKTSEYKKPPIKQNLVF